MRKHDAPGRHCRGESEGYGPQVKRYFLIAGDPLNEMREYMFKGCRRNKSHKYFFAKEYVFPDPAEARFNSRFFAISQLFIRHAE